MAWEAPTMTDLRTDRATDTRPDSGAEQTGSRVARAVWITLGGILAVAGLVWGTFNVVSLLAHEEYTLRTSFPAADVHALEVRNENGSVSIVATETDTVRVVAEVSDGWQATEVSGEILGGVLVLRSGCPPLPSPWCSVDYTVTIPADRPVEVDGSGAVRVRGMSGRVDVDSDDGRVELEDVSGDVIASNDNGSIIGRRLTSAVAHVQTSNGRIELSFVEPPMWVSARTSNGSVDVVVPDDEVLYRVELHTSHGSTDNAVRTDPASEHVIELSTRNGSVTVRPPG